MIQLVTSGCSHSIASDGPVYGDYLADMIGAKHVNISQKGRDIQQTFTDTIRYITKNPVDILVVQLTEFHRLCFHLNEYQDYDMDSPADKNKGWVMIHSPIQHTVYGHPIYREKVAKLGRNTFTTHKMDALAHIISLHSLCKQLDIQLHVINWHNWDNAVYSALFDSVDKSLFLIENSKYGWQNHLLWNDYKYGKNISPHFDTVAHRYTAERLYIKINEGTQTVVEELTHPNSDEVYLYNYTN